MKQYFLYQCRFEAMSDDFPAESAKKSRRISLILKRRQLALASAEAKRIAVEGGWKRDKFMRWTTLNFGKHVGKSLPQIILSDADWFFWAYGRDVFKGRLSIEAEDLASKATRIKIPKSDPENWQVEYRHEDDGRFIEIAIVEAEEPSFRSYRGVRRLPYLDLAFIRRSRIYDKQGCRNLLDDFRRLYFGEGKRLTKDRCEAFFNKRRNFVG